MNIICTACSPQKDNREGLLAAGSRYTGERIEEVKKIAKEQKRPLYFLSGEYGLIPETREIPCYDHQLETDEIGELVDRVREQLQEERVEEIDFYYSKQSERWNLYRSVLEKAGAQAGVTTKNHELG